MQLLTDVFIIENLQVLEEGNKDGKMRICGIFGRAEEENNNGRIYPNKVLGGQVGTLQDLISERRLCGELDHPQNETVKLSNASHLITKLEMRGNDLMGEAEILKTPAGLTAQALINGGVKIGISSRGMGTLSEDYQGKKVVNEDYKLVTFDLVADPSTRGAYPGLAESTQSKFVRETQSKLTKEGNFVTMLESKLRDAYQPWIEEAKITEETAEERKERLLRLQANIRHQYSGRKLPDPKRGPHGGVYTRPMTQKSQDVPMIKGGPGKGTGRAKYRITMPEQSLNTAFELIKADGHWHRIAEMLQGRLQEDISSTMGGDDDEDEAARERAAKAVTQSERERQKTIRKGRSVSGALRGRLAARITSGGRVAHIKRVKRGEAVGDIQAQRIRARGKAGGDVGRMGTNWLGGPGSAKYAKKTRTLQQKKERFARKIERVRKATQGESGNGGKGTKPNVAGGGAGRQQLSQRQQALANVQAGGPTVSPPSAPKPDPTGKNAPSAIELEKAKRARESSAARAALRRRLAAVKGEQEGSKQSFKTSLGRAKTSGRLGKRLQQDLQTDHTAYKQIGRMIAEALGWTL